MDVKCKICGNKIDRDIAYKRTVGKANFYYCSEKEYQDKENRKIQDKAKRVEMNELIYSAIGGKTVNTALFKETAEWLSVADIDTVISYLKENMPDLQQALNNKSFSSEYNKIRYFSAIVKNKLADYQPPKLEIVKPTEIEIYTSTYKPKKRRKCLNDYIDGDGD